MLSNNHFIFKINNKSNWVGGGVERAQKRMLALGEKKKIILALHYNSEILSTLNHVINSTLN